MSDTPPISRTAVPAQGDPDHPTQGPIHDPLEAHPAVPIAPSRSSTQNPTQDSEPTTQDSTLPPLPPAAAALFNAWLAERGDLARIAHALNRPAHALINALRESPLADYIAAAEDLSDRSLRRRGLHRLAEVMDTSPDLPEQRRAATSLLANLRAGSRSPGSPTRGPRTPTGRTEPSEGSANLTHRAAPHETSRAPTPRAHPDGATLRPGPGTPTPGTEPPERPAACAPVMRPHVDVTEKPDLRSPRRRSGFERDTDSRDAGPEPLRRSGSEGPRGSHALLPAITTAAPCPDLPAPANAHADPAHPPHRTHEPHETHLLDAGLDEGQIETLLSAGLEPDEIEDLLDAGLDESRIETLISAGLEPDEIENLPGARPDGGQADSPPTPPPRPP